jgi:adenosylcobinamide-GDP ribazoletransferase
MGLLRGLRSAISFLTIIPAGFGTIEEMASYAFLFPLVGGLLGFIAGLAGLVLFRVLPNTVAPWLLLGTLMLLTGLNHMDGLLDLGDALMVRAPRERKLEILHDKHHGIGGFSLLFIVLALTQSLFAPLSFEILGAMIVSETLAKTALVVMGSIGTPNSGGGLGAIFINSLGKHRRRNLVLSLLIALAVAVLVMRSLLALVPFVITMVFTVVTTKSLQRSFGCITGDMLGSQSELTRAVSLLVLLLVAGL